MESLCQRIKGIGLGAANALLGNDFTAMAFIIQQFFAGLGPGGKRSPGGKSHL
jgi:hypothetical protein